MKMLRLLDVCAVLLVLHCSEIGAKYPRVHLYSKDRNLILKLHNDFRRSVRAANMRELIWDHEAAKAAAEWSRKCIYTARPDNVWGQNMNQFAEVTPEESSPVRMFQDSFNDWSKEGGLYNYHIKDYWKCGRRHACSYVQLLTAEVKGVGCALMNCPDLNMTNEIVHNAQLLVCFYSPGIDILSNRPYIEGAHCSACPRGTSCVNELCKENEDVSQSIQYSLGDPQIRINVEDENLQEFRGQQTNLVIPDKASQNAGGNKQSAVIRYANVVIPFPGADARKDVRQLGRMERKRNRQHSHKSQHSQHSPNRKTSSERRKLSELTGRKEERTNLVRNKRQTSDRRRQDRYYQEQERRRRERLQALRERQDGMTDQEQYFTIAAHNVYRRQEGLRELTWNNRLERWAKYVIRCDIEYPGPITSYTNFGKASKDREVYSVVYRWAAEGRYDREVRLEYGCRTPSDRTVCNHSTVLRSPEITEMACASMDCGATRQLTCIYK